MAIADVTDLAQYCLDVARSARAASEELAQAGGDRKNGWLRQSARSLRDHCDSILEANQLDLDAAADFGLTDAQVDRRSPP